MHATRALLKDACVPGRNPHSLHLFAKYACGWHWRCRNSTTHPYWITNRVHRRLADWYQNLLLEWRECLASGDPRRLRRFLVLIIVPRGFGKSNWITKPASLWLMLVDPNLATAIGSETHPKAKDFLHANKEILSGNDRSAMFTWLYGNWYDPDLTWNRETIVVAARTSTGVSDPSIGTFGVETGLTSKHPPVCAFDDPLTEEKLKEGGTWLVAANKSLKSILYALGPTCFLAQILTRYRDDDTAGTSLEDDGVRSWTGHPPLEEYKEGLWDVFHLQARDIHDTTNYPEGEPTLPEAGWTHEALLEAERADPVGFAAQMMNDASSGEHMEMTKEQVDKLIIPRKDIPSIEYATIHLDTAFKEPTRRGRGDFNVIVVWLHAIDNSGIVYLDRVVRSQNWRAEDMDANLIRVMHDLKRRGIRIRAITDEKEIGGKRGVYERHLHQVLGASGLRIPQLLLLNRGGTKKAIRLREAANYWLDNCVRIPEDAEGKEALIREMLKIGFSKYDDAADAASDVFHPEIYRGRISGVFDDQPPVPVQPGDEFLKGQWERDMAALKRDLERGRQKGPKQNEDYLYFEPRRTPFG
jgi:hypothetical protein